VRSSASSFNFQYLIFSLMPSSSCLHILPHFSFPSILSLIMFFREFMVLDKMGSIVLVALIAHHTPDNVCESYFFITKPMTVLFHKLTPPSLSVTQNFVSTYVTNDMCIVTTRCLRYCSTESGEILFIGRFGMGVQNNRGCRKRQKIFVG
jgi:hypothetical protein